MMPETRTNPHCPECQIDGVANRLKRKDVLELSFGGIVTRRQRWRCKRCGIGFIESGETLEIAAFPGEPFVCK